MEFYSDYQEFLAKLVSLASARDKHFHNRNYQSL